MHIKSIDGGTLPAPAGQFTGLSCFRLFEPSPQKLKKIIEVLKPLLFFGADGGTRTHMISRSILSAVRIPISPHQLIEFTRVILA